jgi:DNA-binding transcriptional regulator YhcF (GntR family)
MLIKGYVKLHRKIVDWEWYKNPRMTHLFLYLICQANYEEKEWRGTKVKVGQLISTASQLSVNTGISISTVRRVLKTLEKTGEISIKKCKKVCVITVCNYMRYLDFGADLTTNLTTQMNTKMNTQMNTFNAKEIESYAYRCKECGDTVCICTDGIMWAAHCMTCDNAIGDARGTHNPCAKNEYVACAEWNEINT